MYAADDAAQLTYVQCGILAAILLNSGAADYVITGLSLIHISKPRKWSMRSRS